MRSLVLLAVAACAADEPSAPELPQPLDAIWAQSIHPGDLIAMVPGTGSYDLLAAPIEQLGPDPIVDVRQIPSVAGDAIVFEQAIGAAHRAGVPTDDLTFGLWGAGFPQPTP